jgi:hypothetical protein
VPDGVRESRCHGRLTGGHAVGVDVTGRIAVVLRVVGVPTELWSELLLAHEGRPGSIAELRVRCPDGVQSGTATQIEVHLDDLAEIPAALDWVARAVAEVNLEHDTRERRLAQIYGEALAVVSDWLDEHEATLEDID